LTSATYPQPEAMMVMRWTFCFSWTSQPSLAVWPAKLIGVIEAEQTEEQKTMRNDRLIAVAADSRNHSHVRFLGDLNSNLLHEIERFFIAYNETKGKRFEVLNRLGPERAEELVVAGMKKFRAGRSKTKRQNA
jgi:inorganic pyrophosphatase